MKKLLLIVMMLCSLSIRAQQEKTNPKLKALRNEKNYAVLQKKINALKVGTVEDLELLIQYYDKSPAKQDAIAKILLKKYPQTENATILRFKAFMSVSGVLEMEALLRSMIKDYPNANLDMEKNLVVMAYAGIPDTTKALALINAMKDPVFKVRAIIQVLEIIAQSDNSKALELAKNELGRAKQIKGQTALSGPLKLDPKGAYYDYINIYGKLLFKGGKNDEAYAFTAEAYDNIKDKDAELIENYALLSSLNGKYERSLPLLADVIKQGKFDKRYIEEVRKGYEKLNPGKDVDAYVDSLKGYFIAKIKDQVRKLMISESAHDFVVKDVNGKSVSLSDFKGKTIVLDFWATWCHPCIESFPAMQMAVNRYRKDDNVKFLFIHTWEYVADPLTDAKNFMSKHNYNFDLYIDPKGKSARHTAATDALKITGIPAKFIIDGNGKIRFKVDGFEGNTEVAAEEVCQMIEMARKVN